MNKFYDDIKDYGNLLIGKYVEEKPIPVDIDENIDYGLYWINKHELFTNIPKKSTVIVSHDDYNHLMISGKINSDYSILSCDNSRKTYANIIYGLYPELVRGDEVRMISKTSTIGFNVLLGNKVTIGNNVVIGNNVIIYDNTIIGDNVRIGDNVVIGARGVAVDEEIDGTLTRFPQIGGVEIGNDVEIESFCDIKRGALKNTIISDGVKIGAYNNIGHNVFIGKNVFISARCNISGSSIIGDNSTLWVNSTIKHKITVPKRSIVGSNTFVNKNFEGENITLIGIPAKIK